MKHEILWYPENGLIKDKYGRTRIFRGVNLGGVKSPVPPEESGVCRISYKDRPFSESEADVHFKRLAAAGFNLIRWGVTWEAVEHDGPEMYDEDFLAYTRLMIKKAEEYGFAVIIEPYQNAWSRWTGGCGAPLWTLEKAGFNVAALEGCGAIDKDSVRLSYHRYACQTMFTLFFAGNTFAPDFQIDGISAQDYLQEHYIAAMYHVARRLKDCGNIMGFGIMNDVSAGYIGVRDLGACGIPDVPEGVICTPFEGMKAAAGYGASFNRFELKHSDSEVSLRKKIDIKPKDKDSEKAVRQCPWFEAGVWHTEDGKPVLDEPGYFYMAGGKPVDFHDDFLRPFQQIFMEALQKKHPEYIFFSECVPAGVTGDFSTAGEFRAFDGNICAYGKVRTEYLERISDRIITEAEKCRGSGAPALMSEFGVPAGTKDGASVLTAYMETAEKALISTVISEYSAEPAGKDGSCTAEFNIFDADKVTFPFLAGFSRPYAVATAGRLVSMSFSTDDGPCFEMEWDSLVCPEGDDPACTEIFVPRACFPAGWKVAEFDGKGTFSEDPVRQILYVRTTEVRRSYLKITAK